MGSVARCLRKLEKTEKKHASDQRVLRDLVGYFSALKSIKNLYENQIRFQRKKDKSTKFNKLGPGEIPSEKDRQ